MKTNFKTLFEDRKNIPPDFGVYKFFEKYDLSDDEVQLKYSSLNDGDFTISFYNKSDTHVPDDLKSTILIDEFEHCIDLIFESGEFGIYHDVELLKKELFSFDNNSEPFFHSAVFRYWTVSEEDIPYQIEKLSFLYLRSDSCFFHKIRFTMDFNNDKSTLGEMYAFLIKWREFINYIKPKPV